MESVRTGQRIGDISVVATLLCLTLAWPVGAESGGNPDSRDDSFAPAPVIGASRPEPDQVRREPAESPADRPIAASDDAAPGLDIALDAPADVMAPFAQTPLAAWLLVGVCILGASLAPRARPRTRSDEEDARLAEPPAGGEVRRTDLTGPRRTPG
jgi:hypothetical protein